VIAGYLAPRRTSARIALGPARIALGFACVALGLACMRGELAAPANLADAGIAIAIYRAGDRAGYAVVDDRRWVDVDGDSLVLDHIDPRAALSSLVIEAVDARRGALEVGACTRDRIPGPAAPAFVPTLHCAVRGARGRRLVRVLYVLPGLDYRVSHDVAMTAADRATVASRFSIATPAWHRRAELTLHDGIPGAQQPPREIARGSIALDGGVAVLASPPRVVTAQLRRIYDGAVHRHGEIGPRDLRWRRESHPAVWIWLELTGAALAPGPVRVHVELANQPIRDIDVPALGRRTVAGALALPLWIDDELRGRRDRWSQSHDDAAIVERFAISVANLGTTARDVWIEETLRPSRRRTVRHAWPSTPILLEASVRMKLTVSPGKIERCGFEIDYELQGTRDR
jgi:hypothetical protein